MSQILMSSLAKFKLPVETLKDDKKTASVTYVPLGKSHRDHFWSYADQTAVRDRWSNMPLELYVYHMVLTSPGINMANSQL